MLYIAGHKLCITGKRSAKEHFIVRVGKIFF